MTAAQQANRLIAAGSIPAPTTSRAAAARRLYLKRKLRRLGVQIPPAIFYNGAGLTALLLQVAARRRAAAAS